MNKLSIAMLGMALAGSAGAKLPAQGPEAQAKAEEAKQKTAWSDKVAAYQLCKAQDRVAAAYRQKKEGQSVPASTTAAPAAGTATAPAAAPVTAPAAPVVPVASAAGTPAPAATPVVAGAAPAIPTCQDPGPYAAAAAADAAKVGVADSLPVPAAGKPLTPAEAKK